MPYLLAAWVGQGLAIIPGIDITVWPPAGLVLATLAVSRPTSCPSGWWPQHSASSLRTPPGFGNPPAFTGLYAVGNAAAAASGASLYRWLSPLPRHLNTRRQTLNFVLVAGTAPLVAATVIAFVDAFLAEKHGFSETWALVWLGDTTGILATAPLVFVATQYWASRRELTLGWSSSRCSSFPLP